LDNPMLLSGEQLGGTKSSISFMSANADQINTLKAVSKKNYAL